MFRPIETLEERRLLSATLNSTTHVLTVTGTAGSDTIFISQNGSNITAKVGRETKSFRASAVKRIVVNGLAGDDKILTAPNCTKPETIDAGDGNDTVVGGAAADTISGGTGNDLIDGAGGGDVISGGTGLDTVDYSHRRERVHVSLDGVADDGATGEKDNVKGDCENVTGGAGDDTIVGNDAANVLRGGGGNDTVAGQGGDDTLDGGDGDDTLDGGAGNNRQHGGRGRDHFEHGPGGDDTVDDRGDEDHDDRDDDNGGEQHGQLEFEGQVSAVDAAAGTITLTRGGASVTLTVPSTATISVDGVAGKTLADVPTGPGTEAHVNVAIDDQGNRTVLSVSVRSAMEDDDGTPAPTPGGVRSAAVVSVDADNSKITVGLPLEHGPALQLTLNVAADAVITVDGQPATLAGLPAGLKIQFTLSATDATTITKITAVGPVVEGRVANVDTTLNTITLGGLQPRTFTLAAGATISVNGVSGKTLADLTAGAEVRLQLSALDPKTVLSVKGHTASGGTGGGGGTGSGEHDDDDHLPPPPPPPGGTTGGTSGTSGGTSGGPG